MVGAALLDEKVTFVDDMDVADDTLDTKEKWSRPRGWTNEEDKALTAAVEEHGVSSWCAISKFVRGRSSKQCRERWHNQLRPEINRGPWSEEEDSLILDLVRKHGRKWAFISRQLPGRTDNAVKKRFDGHIHRNLDAKEAMDVKPTPKASRAPLEKAAEDNSNGGDDSTVATSPVRVQHNSADKAKRAAVKEGARPKATGSKKPIPRGRKRPTPPVVDDVDSFRPVKREREEHEILEIPSNSSVPSTALSVSRSPVKLPVPAKRSVSISMIDDGSGRCKASPLLAPAVSPTLIPSALIDPNRNRTQSICSNSSHVSSSTMSPPSPSTAPAPNSPMPKLCDLNSGCQALLEPPLVDMSAMWGYKAGVIPGRSVSLKKTLQRSTIPTSASKHNDVFPVSLHSLTASLSGSAR